MQRKPDFNQINKYIGILMKNSMKRTLQLYFWIIELFSCSKTRGKYNRLEKKTNQTRDVHSHWMPSKTFEKKIFKIEVNMNQTMLNVRKRITQTGNLKRVTYYLAAMVYYIYFLFKEILKLRITIERQKEWFIIDI